MSDATPSRLRQPLSLAAQRRVFVGWVLAIAVGLAFLAVPGPRAAKAALKLTEAHAAGHAAGTADYVAYWVPRAAKGGLVLAGLMLLGSRFLVRTVPALDSENPVGVSAVPRRQGIGLAVFTLLIIGYSAVANAPRLNFGLWGDEESTMRKSVVGQFERDAAGQLKADPVTWQETIFRYRDPNNHPLNSVMSRLSHEFFSKDLTRPDGFYFDEKAMRLPVFAVSLLGLGAVAWLGWVLGKPVLGGFAVLLLAAHPWFIRYGVESRGYGYLLCFAPLAMGSLVCAVRGGKWRWWICYGLSQFLILWSYPGALHLLIALNASALCMIFGLRGVPTGWRSAQAGRWFTACVLGALLCALLMLPCVQPLLYYLKSPRMHGPMPGSWYADALAWLTTGIPWRSWDSGNPLAWSWEQACGTGVGLRVVTGLFMVGFGAGLAGWWRQGGIFRALVPALLLQGPLFLLQAYLTSGFIYAWYLQPGLVGIVLVFAGLALWPRSYQVVSMTLLSGLFFFLTFPAARLLRENPIEQMREGTKLCRPVSLASDPRIDEVMTVDIIMTTRGYDPAVLPLEADDPVKFSDYLRQSDLTKKPLFVHFGSPDFADSVRPRVMALIRNPAIFEPVATLPGMDGPYTRQVFRYRAGSVPAVAGP